MYFKRFFKNGESFPKRFAVYYCKFCKKEEIYEAMKVDYSTEPKPCPICKHTDDNDRKESLLTRRTELTAIMSKYQQELDVVNVELVMLEEPTTKTKEPTHGV